MPKVLPLLIVKLGDTIPDLAARRGGFETWIAAALGDEAEVVEDERVLAVAGERLEHDVRALAPETRTTTRPSLWSVTEARPATTVTVGSSAVCQRPICKATVNRSVLASS